ncbi:unnamed protein product [Linum trigynum]|uniref:Uncharacterized protein n=1 Tax=Linum trigynum TaxID=586398 RepID=A0AAV2F443_9ROSI
MILISIICVLQNKRRKNKLDIQTLNFIAAPRQRKRRSLIIPTGIGGKSPSKHLMETLRVQIMLIVVTYKSSHNWCYPCTATLGEDRP